jgi:hypothetical protein
VMKTTSVISNSAACPPRRQSEQLAGLGVVCLISVLGLVITGFVCFLGFRSEITAAMSDDMTGSIMVQDPIMNGKVNSAAVQPIDSHH